MLFLLQISLPGMASHLLVPLPLAGPSETYKSSAKDVTHGTRHVRMCADNVCSLQVRHCDAIC